MPGGRLARVKDAGGTITRTTYTTQGRIPEPGHRPERLRG